MSVVDRIQDSLSGEVMYLSDHSSNQIPFVLPNQPLLLTKQEIEDINNLGGVIKDFLRFIEEKYKDDQTLRELLDKGKPEYLKGRVPKYLFFRPDIFPTADGLKVCEIETSIFGLGLSDMLVNSFEQEYQGFFESSGLDMKPDSLSLHAKREIDSSTSILYSDKTSRNLGQLRYIARKVFGLDSGPAAVKHVENGFNSLFYRAFYLSEIPSFIGDSMFETNMANSTPSPTPFMEEKALMAIVWDKRWEDSLKLFMGDYNFEKLRKYIPPTWILGQEEFFSPKLPDLISNSLEISSLSKSKRRLVLKESGFGDSSSWGQGVVFLDKISGVAATEKINAALEISNSGGPLFIIQQYFEPRKIFLEKQMRWRVTPYYDANQGSLLSIKATGRENTRYIHGASDSYNTVVALER